MKPEAEPVVVLIDDHPDDVLGLRGELADRGLAAEAIEPEHLTLEMIKQTDVFLLDMFLHDWPERERLEPATQVLDGIALAGVIRGHSRAAKLSPPVIALHTGHPDDIAELPHEIREHALARAYNLEWVFLKNDSNSLVPTADRVKSLASARTALPNDWRDSTAERQLLEALDGQEDELPQILECWPPIREVGRATAGTAVLRWLLHRILPYPCFLIDERHVAARLGITLDSLKSVMQDESDLAKSLDACAYGGVLADFDGPRWWRQRLESTLWALGGDGGLPARPDELQAHTSTELELARSLRGVIVLDANYRPRDVAVDVSDAVRVRLDDWPPYAEEPWSLIRDAQEDEGLRDRVLPLDRGRL